MSRWFRWYEQTCEDGKFRVVARMSRVTVRDVIALWAFMLEDAANVDHRGVCRRDEDFMAGVLDFEEGVVEEVLAAMEKVGMISVGHGAITLCNWGKRQFEGDVDPTAAERQRRKRERDAQTSHADVTRDSRPPDTDTDTDTDTKTEKKKERVEAREVRAAQPKTHSLPASRPPSKASRWPSEAVVPDDWIVEGEAYREAANYPPIDLRAEALKFANYWASKSGGGATKTDWKRTWLNWVLTANAGRNGTHSGQPRLSDHPLGIFGEIGDELRARRAGGGTSGA